MNNPSAAEFAAALRLERDAVSAFVEILQREQDALIQGADEELDFLAATKERMLKELAGFAERRNHYLASRGLTQNGKGVDAWLAQGPNTASAEQPAESTSVWNDLMRLAWTARQLNQTNGAIIATRLQRTQRALEALRRAAGTVALYGPKGQTFGIGSGRALGAIV